MRDRSSILQPIFDLARTAPDRPAVDDHGNIVTYSELISRASGFADVFRQLGSEAKVLINLPAGEFAYAALLGSIQSGATFAFVSTATPPAACESIAAQFDPDLLLGPSTWCDKLASVTSAQRMTQWPPSEILDRTIVETTSAVYVVFTSGSTGDPKGIAVGDRPIFEFVRWARDFYSPTPADRWAQFSRLTFDLSLVDVFTALSCGACLVPFSGEFERLRPGRFVEQSKVTVWHSVPSLIPMLLEAGSGTPPNLEAVRLFTFCGEPLLTERSKQLLSRSPSALVCNTYGPTEGTLFCSAQQFNQEQVGEESQATLPIGDPIPGWHFEFALVDEDLEEITILSHYLADGYIGPVTDSGFQDPRDAEYATVRRFRTGDLVRRIDGATYFASRADRQVKVKGMRLELTAIELELIRLGFGEAQVCLEPAGLIAYVTGDTELSDADVGDSLRIRLPPEAVPVRLIRVQEFPRLSSGKVDLRALATEVTDDA
jgi:D-alanine--poly(phosphoribitol) ligase subunit 1